jgi:hypothetical protein
MSNDKLRKGLIGAGRALLNISLVFIAFCGIVYFATDFDAATLIGAVLASPFFWLFILAWVGIGGVMAAFGLGGRGGEDGFGPPGGV